MSVKIALVLAAGITWLTLPMQPDPLSASLLQAVDARDLAAVTASLAKGAKVNSADAFHRTALHKAANQAPEEIIELLIARGADINARDNDGRTPLHLANSMSAAVLLKHKADITLRDKQGNTVLHTAAEQDGAAMCRLLVAAGIKADVRNTAGLTPLHFAALQGKKPSTEFLLSVGADINAKSTAPYSYKWTYVDWDVKGMEEAVGAGETAMSIAKAKHKKNKYSTSRYADLAEFLKTKGAK